MKTADDLPETSGESPESNTSPDGEGRRGSLLLALGFWLVLVGVVGLVVSGSFHKRATVSRVGSDAPVNASARSAQDVDAHNSPNVVRNPVRPSNLAVADRIDTPFYSCALHVSFDSGATWQQTPVPAPRGEEAKCFRP